MLVNEQLRSKLYDLLCKFDKICEENNLTYWLDGGTALGAVRHKGFIPWDDDVDVAMPYKDFKKLLHLSADNFPKDVELQSPRECGQHFAKLRDCNSTFLEFHEIPSVEYNQGVYLDIFPMVFYPKFSDAKRIRVVKSFQNLWRRIQLNRERKIPCIFDRFHFILKKILWDICSTKTSGMYMNPPEDNGYNKIHYLKDLYPLRKIFFEGGEFFVPNKVERYLTDLYGDYTVLPPEDKRTTHVKFFDTSTPCLYIQSRKQKINLAPVCIFVFNRLQNTKKTLNSLKKNYLANQTDLYIFSDAAKPTDLKNKKKVLKIRNYLKKIKGFNSVKIIEREKNFYIEQNIIQGVNEVLCNHDRIIVLEDDVLTSKSFLLYMNNCLNIYAKEKKIAQISAWQTVKNISKYPKTIFWRYLEIGGGWAIWKDRWEKFKYYQTEAEALNDMTENEKESIQFHNTFKCLDTLKLSPIPWDICLFISIIKNKQLTVNPSFSLTKNIGLYNGSHFSSNKFLKKNKYDCKILKNREFFYDTVIEENLLATSKLESFFLERDSSDRIVCYFIKVILLPYRMLKYIYKIVKG